MYNMSHGRQGQANRRTRSTAQNSVETVSPLSKPKSPPSRKIRPIPPNRRPPISSNQRKSRAKRQQRNRNENAEPKRGTNKISENHFPHNKSTISLHSNSAPVRPAAEFLLQQTNRRKSVSKSNSQASPSSLRNFGKPGIGATVANVFTPPRCRKRSKNPGSSDRSCRISGMRP